MLKRVLSICIGIIGTFVIGYLMLLLYIEIMKKEEARQIEKNVKIAQEMIQHIYKKELGIDVVLSNYHYIDHFPVDVHNLELNFFVNNDPEYQFSSKVVLKKSDVYKRTYIDSFTKGEKFAEKYFRPIEEFNIKNNDLQTNPYTDLYYDGRGDGPSIVTEKGTSIDTFVKDYANEPFIEEIYKKHDY